MSLLLNGKFLGRPLTGVDRYALEISARMATLLAQDGQVLEVAVPASSRLEPDSTKRLSAANFIRSFDFNKPTIWEQMVLTFVRPRALLLSLCNIGPLLRSNQCLMIADAQFVTQASSYSWAFRTWYRLALPLVARRAKTVVTISEFSKAELEGLGVIPVGKARVVPCGVDHVHDFIPDTSVVQRLGLTFGSYLLIIGSRARHKNVGPLLKALRGNLPQDAKILLVGGGNSTIFADEGIEPGDDVLMPGRVSDEELVALYKNARAFLFPSLTEGFGLPPAEAMALGCPVIASNRGAIPEVMGDACMYVDPLDSQGWVDAVRLLWDDADLRADLAAQGLARSREWTWDRSTRLLMDLLGESSGTRRS